MSKEIPVNMSIWGVKLSPAATNLHLAKRAKYPQLFFYHSTSEAESASLSAVGKLISSLVGSAAVLPEAGGAASSQTTLFAQSSIGTSVTCRHY